MGALRPERAAPVTIRDVAREANVSVASASRVLNGMDNVTDAMRDKVLSVAERLRFVPNSAGRILSTRRTNTLGVILPDLHGEFFSEAIRGADLAARKLGQHLLLSGAHDGAEDLAAVIRSMRGRVDGLIVMSPHVSEDVLTGNLAEGLPVVLLNTKLGGEGHPSICVDNYAGAFAVTRHLAERARVVAHIAGPTDNNEARERLRGWEDAAGEKMGPLFEGDFNEGAGIAAGHVIAAMTPLPDAVFAANDMMALGCLIALAEAGVRVPDDVKVAGFDDVPIARLVRPALTTVRSEIAELSRRAVERLARLVGASEPEESEEIVVTVRPQLVVRESTSSSVAPAKS